MKTNLAKFTINNTPSVDTDGNSGYDATAGETLSIKLEANPPAGVTAVKFSVHDENDVENSPLASNNYTQQLFQNGLASITFTDPTGTATIEVDATTEISSFIIRCEANTAHGKDVFERLIAVRENGLRLTVPAESTEYSARGYSDAINDIALAVVTGSGGGGGLPAQGPNTIVGNAGTTTVVPTAQAPQGFEFVNSTAGAGNIRGKVAPQGFGAIAGLTNGGNTNVDIALTENGTYQFSILVRAKMATSGTRLTRAVMVCANRESGTLTLEGTPLAIDIGVGSGIALTVSTNAGNLRVNVANSSGETLNGRVHVGWFVEDLI
jgi:hypothetical protein